MFTTRCFIRKNSKELQEKLARLGYSLCICCKFDGAVWLNNFIDDGTIHGWGYVGEDAPFPTTEGMLQMFLEENEDPQFKDNHQIDCGTNEELFLALAAMRDDTDKNQWFRFKDTDYFDLCWYDEFHRYTFNSELAFDVEDTSNEWHKATVEELIEHFNHETK